MATTARRKLSTRTRFEILKRDGFRCRYCGRGAHQVDLHIDHVVAVANGGTDDPANLVAACADCNLGKSAVPLGAAAPGATSDAARAPQPRPTVICDVCHTDEATHIHLVPYASPPCEAIAACATCDPGGYHIDLTEWRHPRERLEWERHLIDTKDDGPRLIALIQDRIGRRESM